MMEAIRRQLEARRARRREKELKRFQETFDAEFARTESVLHQTVLRHAQAMARGMVMRYMDDHGIRRCCFCVDTDQLRKKTIEQRGASRFPGNKAKPRQKIVFVCPAHWESKLPGEVAEALAPGVGTRPHVNAHASATMNPKALQDIAAVYQKAQDEKKPLRDIHPIIPPVGKT